MGEYTVDFLPTAARRFRALDPSIQRRIGRRVDALTVDPRPPGIKALQGRREVVLRLRVGDWRILYRVDDVARRVTVIDVGHRREIYRS